MHISLEVGASIILSAISVIVSILVSSAKADVRINSLEGRVTQHGKDLDDAQIAIAMRNEEMKAIHEKLNTFNPLLLDVQTKLADIQTRLVRMETDLDYIKKERGVENGKR